MIIEYSDSFLKEAKKLSKKFKLLKPDLKQAVDEIETKNDLGVYLGFNLFKKRVKNSSIPTGKSGGFRIIIYKQIENKIVLISIYSKTEKENLSDDELTDILKKHIDIKK
ncbi:type II toxin-antitoxin system RelE/ParE family toxin [Poseidonibacter lekithochrous]|uniref:type II toxin-antitoxin system RelE/ParE family toxin n=1 Tax=Poseidonibacter lekithochrous TaxID=1904463 RepID=UPI000AEC9227|nr:type II toxin-antitoxin system RelE/ParE family toxin [Poseidonibacter lekithochrous]QKJ23811.1 toxin-antitoxin system, toxin component, RelE/ParE family [Poseidonibacter lekithochrous]